MADNGLTSSVDLLSQQEGSLASAAASGRFAVDPAAARAAAQICQSYSGTIREQLNQPELARLPSLGSFWMANNLSEHFHNKAVGAADTNSLSGVIAGVVQLMDNLGQIFGQVADGYTQNEQQVQTTVRQSGNH
jgi:hypothetical protein